MIENASPPAFKSAFIASSSIRLADVNPEIPFSVSLQIG